MTKQKFKRVAIIVGMLVVALVACASLALHFATQALKNQVQRALGASSEVGEIKVGWIDIVGKNSEISTQLRGVDLIALQPYLIKAAETGVRRGTLDLDLKSTVRDNHLNAPGKMTLSGLELESGGGAMSTFMGVPRKAVIASLENGKDQIVVPFTLEGNLNDPHFSLNENLAAHIGSGIASTLGISIEGLAHGVGSAAQGVEGAVKKLFGK